MNRYSTAAALAWLHASAAEKASRDGKTEDYNLVAPGGWGYGTMQSDGEGDEEEAEERAWERRITDERRRRKGIM